MTRRNNSQAAHDRREEYARLALKSGRFYYQQTGSRVRCSFCGRRGWMSGYWMDDCLRGHPFVCACGRVFATRQAIASHRRALSNDCWNP